MKIGIFDSGLGGLVIAHAIIKRLPHYDYVYYGDTKNIPYGQKSQKTIYRLTVRALEKLFQEGCNLVIIACNTSSAKALRKIQREFLPKYHPNKKVLGVIAPTIEEVAKNRMIKTVGVIATSSTAKSHAYKKEIAKIRPGLKIFEQGAPKLVPLIENDLLELGMQAVGQYLLPLKRKNIGALVLGCTHYPLLKAPIQKALGKRVKIFSQETIIPGKLANYLKRHAEIESRLGRGRQKKFLVTKLTREFQTIANRLFGKRINLALAK